MQNMQDRGGETVWALGIHTVNEIVVNMQNGSVLLPALNVVKKTKKHGIATSDKVNRDPLQFVA